MKIWNMDEDIESKDKKRAFLADKKGISIGKIKKRMEYLKLKVCIKPIA